MHRLFLSLNAYTRRLGFASVFDKISREYLFIASRNGYAYAVVLAFDGHKIANGNYFVSVLVFSAEGNDALGIIVIGNPLKALP